MEEYTNFEITTTGGDTISSGKVRTERLGRLIFNLFQSPTMELERVVDGKKMWSFIVRLKPHEQPDVIKVTTHVHLYKPPVLSKAA